ncbi:MAG TPA: ABC transporter ATP-binding protein [Gammaproteobacteria bacterium]
MQTAVSIRGLVKVFSDGERDHRVLPGVSLEIAESSFVTIVGPSGSGKTTLLNIIAGLEEQTEGDVDIHSGSRATQLGYVFQSARLLPWLTIEDNLRFVRPEHSDEAEFETGIRRYLDLVGLGNVGRKYPHQLSGGMQQRVGIARALCVEPAVLLMDEPFSHLDEITAEQMRAELLRIWKETQRTIIFITHDMREAVTLGDRLVMLNFRGEVVEDLEIGLPRPREFSDKRFIEFYAGLVQRFHTLQVEEADAEA